MFFWTIFHESNGFCDDTRDRYEVEENIVNSMQQIWMMVFALCSVAARFSCHLNTFLAQEGGQREEQSISRGFTVFGPGTSLASRSCPGM